VGGWRRPGPPIPDCVCTSSNIPPTTPKYPSNLCKPLAPRPSNNPSPPFNRLPLAPTHSRPLPVLRSVPCRLVVHHRRHRLHPNQPRVAPGRIRRNPPMNDPMRSSNTTTTTGSSGACSAPSKDTSSGVTTNSIYGVGSQWNDASRRMKVLGFCPLSRGFKNFIEGVRRRLQARMAGGGSNREQYFR
jgi:hypothetical protein